MRRKNYRRPLPKLVTPRERTTIIFSTQKIALLASPRGRHFRKIGSLAARAACECKPVKWLVFEFARDRKPVGWLAFEFARGREGRASHASETLLRNWGWTSFGGVQRGRPWVNPVQANARPELSFILTQYNKKYFPTIQSLYRKDTTMKKILFLRRDQSADAP